MSWTLEPWQPVEILEHEPEVIDVQWQPVESDNSPLVLAEPVDVQATWIELDTHNYPVKRESDNVELARYVSDYIVTDDDMNTAREWLERVDAMQQTQLAAITKTQPQTLTAFWHSITNPIKVNTRKYSQATMQSNYNPSSAGHGARWYFIAEPNPDEPESLQHLRYWFMQYQYAEGVTEWSEAAFIEWLQGLTDDELSSFADAGEQIALGNWQSHVNEPTANVIEQTRTSDECGPISRMVNSILDVF